ncbi:hypothetical protein HK103_005659 [Boothiomyces macroporosus]|uniref:Uncharacterized protein n=1 Tax=Boothiomyces macroporosus TaxID=261099 RepID=A0AAD5Y367_9FUNG|nr:hypothetical protein HK103_005659 [Boothiomyces macroporosus]
MLVLISTVSALSIYKRGIDCQGAPYCGVLALEAGRGSGNYNQPTPMVHGLWPEVGNFGNSQCAGGDVNAPVALASCYNDLTFQTNEWQKHGVCGAKDPSSFFTQVCALAAGPLQTLSQLRQQGLSIQQMAAHFTGVYAAVSATDSIELYACAGSDLVWRLADISQFNSACAI